MTDREFTKILDWPGYRVYRHEIHEQRRTLKLWVRRKSGNRVLVCSGCGGKARKLEEVEASLGAAFADVEGEINPILNGFLLTSFHKGLATGPLEGYAGNFGSPNNFFGIPVSAYFPPASPVVPPPHGRVPLPPHEGRSPGAR